MPAAENTPTILLVEDDASNREALSDALRCCGFRVVAAADGAHALALLTQVEFDLVISDYNLPDMMGTELLEAIHLQTALPRSAAVVVSGEDHLFGEFAYLPKPCELDRLVEVLRERTTGSSSGHEVSFSAQPGA